MTDKIKEQISAMVDGELPEAEQQLLLKRITRDRSLAERWSRYHLISDVLRQQLPDYAAGDLSEKVHVALDHESTLQSANQSRGWLKPVAGMAVAASVALAAVVAVRTLPGTNPEVPAVAAIDAPALPGNADIRRVAAGTHMERVTPAGTRWIGAKPPVANRLNAYLVNHSEYAGSKGVGGMLPYVRIVGYDSAPEKAR